MLFSKINLLRIKWKSQFPRQAILWEKNFWTKKRRKKKSCYCSGGRKISKLIKFHMRPFGDFPLNIFFTKRQTNLHFLPLTVTTLSVTTWVTGSAEPQWKITWKPLLQGWLKKDLNISVVLLCVEDLRHRSWENLFTVICVAIARSQNVQRLSGVLQLLHSIPESFSVKNNIVNTVIYVLDLLGFVQ